MASPSDFYVQPGNDASQALSGLSGTLGAMRAEKTRQAERQQMIDAQNEKEQRIQERFNAARGAAQEALKSGDPDKMAQVTLEYPEIGQGLTQAFGLVDDAKKKDAASFTRELLSNPQAAEEIYDRRIKYLQDNGRSSVDSERSRDAFRKNPQGELRNMEMIWAGTGDPSYAAYSGEKKAAAKAAADQAKIDREDQRFAISEAGRDRRASQRAAAGTGGSGTLTAHRKDFDYYQGLPDGPDKTAFGQAAGFVSREGREMSAPVQKRLSDAIDAGVSAENNIAKYSSLADQMESADFAGGVAGNISEKLKEVTGDQDVITDLRKRAYQARATQAMANLPPGAASDPDVKIAFQPMPTDNASPQTWARWLRAQSKVQKFNSDFNNFKAQYISDTGSERGMLAAWKSQGGSAEAAPASRSAPAASSGPAAGAVVDGYRFKGGDPAVQANWEPQ